MEELTPSERKKIMEIMKEKERNVPNMDWMYTKSKPDTDDYLLGKKVDKQFEKQDEPEEPIPQGDVFGERIKANITLDMQAKMREDPLFAIKKVEEESRKKLLQNPIKMKQLKKMIEQQKVAKKKKKKKHRHKKDNSDSEEDDLISKYLSILNKKHNKTHASPNEKHKRSHSKGDKSDRKDSKRRVDNSYQDNSNHSRKDNSRTRTLSDGSSEGVRVRDSREHYKRDRLKDRRRSEDREESEKEERRGMSFPSDFRSRRHDSSSSEDGRPKTYGLIKMNKQQRSKSRSPIRTTRKQSPDSHRSSHRHRSRSPNRGSRKESAESQKSHRHRSSSPVKSNPRRPSPKKKLSSEERAKKLAEMMDNAKWREDQRKSNVKHYEQEDRKEEEYENKGRGQGAKFLNPMLSKHASESSVEDRLKRNKYNIQRRKADLDRNFTEK